METTAQAADWREQMDISTPHAERTEKDPLYYNLFGPNQWPSEKHLPEFRKTFEEYTAKMSDVSVLFTQLIAESLNLPATAFDKFFDDNQ